MSPQPPRGHVFWLYGLSGAGKSTLAAQLATSLRAAGRPVLELDGDLLRSGLCQGLGFSDADRAENLRRAAEAAKLGARSGLCVVAAFITPLAAHRDLVASILGTDRVSFVHVHAPLAVCQQRDVKGLYARARAGQIQQMTGLGSAFEPPSPTHAQLTLDTNTEPVDASARRLLAFASGQLTAIS